MPATTTEKKRKASAAPPADTSSPSIKKTKKASVSTLVVAPTKKPTHGSAVTKDKKEAQINKPAPRKRAADFYSDDDVSDGGWDQIADKKGKKKATLKDKNVKKAKVDSTAKPSVEKKKEEKDSAAKKTAPKKAAAKPVADDEISLHSDDSDADAKAISNAIAQVAPKGGSDNDSEEDSEEEEEEEDDQTAALLKGFESSDESESEPDDETLKKIKRREFKKLKIPDVQKKIQARNKSTTTPGYIYLGRIPHGFYEHEMRAYFSQFGTLLRLRLSRNKRTGHSKHYAFLEFASSEVAGIVAETMDNYLLYGRILKCKIIPRNQIEDVDRLFKGANRRFKKVPWTDLARREVDKKRTKEEWEKIQGREERRRKKREAVLKELGIEYEFTPKRVEVVVQQERKTTVAVTEKTVEKEKGEAQPVSTEAKEKTKKSKKSKKTKKPAAATTTEEDTSAMAEIIKEIESVKPAEEDTKPKKSKKTKETTKKADRPAKNKAVPEKKKAAKK